MVLITIFLVSGIIIGFLLRKKDKALFVADRITKIFIYILLLFLGISFGTNKQVLSNLSRFGLEAIVISLSGVIGSIIVSYLVYKYLFKEKRNEE